MREVNRTALLPYHRDELFVMVNDIARYPDFVRWCKAAEIHSSDERETTASITLEARGMSEVITTRNVLHPPELIRLELVDGPFEHFQGGWRFTDLSSADQTGTKVELNLRFVLASKMLNAAFGTVFTRVANTLVDAFCERAHAVLKR